MIKLKSSAAEVVLTKCLNGKRRIGDLVRRIQTAALPLELALRGKKLIILGGQKSGTTAIAASLARLIGRSATLDLSDPQHHSLLPLVARGDISFREYLKLTRKDFARPVFKDPTHTIFYPELREWFPHAVFIFIIRDPRDVIRSIFDRLDIDGQNRRKDVQKFFGENNLRTIESICGDTMQSLGYERLLG